MQTHFTDEQLKDPKLAEANRILRTCVHCGFCLATCPTYVLLGDELDSPRGRIYLMKQMLEEGRPATAQEVKHIDRCLSCLACMTTCPSGVHYMHLVDEGRAHIERTYRRPFLDRLIRNALAAVIPELGRFRAAVGLSRLGRPLAPLLRRVPGLKPLAAMLALAPPRLAPRSAAARRGVHPPQGERRARVVLLTGCVQDVLEPAINAATIRLLNRLGVEVVVPEAMGCCGSLTQHMGKEDDALARARRNIDAWTPEMDGEGLDAIVANASGCGTTLKEYGHMLRLDPAYADKILKLTDIQRSDHPVDECVVYALGDIVEGELIFPGQSHLIDASLYRQVTVDGPRILIDFLRRLLGHFTTVKVVWVIGNHGRLGGRSSRDYSLESNADRMARDALAAFANGEMLMLPPTAITLAELDTSYFIGNSPGSASLTGTGPDGEVRIDRSGTTVTAPEPAPGALVCVPLPGKAC